MSNDVHRSPHRTLIAVTMQHTIVLVATWRKSECYGTFLETKTYVEVEEYYVPLISFVNSANGA
eukprot:scaffold54661_cov45-Prasinocladus_malaysianus.AAC.2